MSTAPAAGSVRLKQYIIKRKFTTTSAKRRIWDNLCGLFGIVLEHLSM
jgi:hypothetical protein